MKSVVLGLVAGCIALTNATGFNPIQQQGIFQNQGINSELPLLEGGFINIGKKSA